MNKSWGGRFTKGTDKRVEDFTESISFDRELYRQDICGSLAHAEMLAGAGLISRAECARIRKGLSGILADIENGKFKFRRELEDVHMNIEAELTNRIGDAGKRLHTARSRNDQVALDLRLWTAAQAEGAIELLRALQSALVRRAGEQRDAICPGFTHMQPAQPVLLAHQLLAYVEMLDRDAARFGECRKRCLVSPLGACALAGTSLPTDPQDTAKRLALDAVFDNSIDAVSDRDFAIEFAFDAALCAMHLSRLSEEWILWCSPIFGFIELDDAFCTGSSIMPQKKNPDVLELIRGKTARVYGDLMSLLVLMKGLPLAYNRDMQEDKPPLFDSASTLRACLSVLEPLVMSAEFKAERMLDAASAGYPDATILAEYLVEKGVPFREAHGIVGRAVALCVKSGRPRLSQMSIGELRELSGRFDAGVLKRLGPAGCAKAYKSRGSSGRREVERQLGKWGKKLGIAKIV
ncbi:MAG TPA: argininosuccinate lyase [Candidatus Brocadiia bacterium]|nr:argininosuccinate lyase [Candidatus Brocadiia bacterium]